MIVIIIILILILSGSAHPMRRQQSDSTRTRASMTDFRHFEYKHMNDFYFPIHFPRRACEWPR